MVIIRFLLQVISGILYRKNIFIIKCLNYKNGSLLKPEGMDYIRLATLALCHEQITKKSIHGNVAELGVYKGDFAKSLNSLFSDRSLYLFDTFEGFNEKDIKTERFKNFSTGSQDFSDTSVDFVLRKMRYPKNCVVRKGFFPDTAVGIDDTFCFVSIDADLYEPILHGLQFFYPKLEEGGYIFIHDFNNDEYKGSREAVLKYCKENNIGYVPLPDDGGTVIIAK